MWALEGGVRTGRETKGPGEQEAGSPTQSVHRGAAAGCSSPRLTSLSGKASQTRRAPSLIYMEAKGSMGSLEILTFSFAHIIFFLTICYLH